AILGPGLEVEEIVLDLERDAEEEAQADQRVERHSAARPDQAAHAHWIDREEPASFLKHHPQVILVAEIGSVFTLPAEFERLTFGAFPGHTLGFLENAQ